MNLLVCENNSCIYFNNRDSIIIDYYENNS